ncbi:hypothetical protein SAMN05216184_102115 [Georgenia satyanarayanai]|uniref:GPI inositol-deacylase PGAP1-like alpha/beta domain-containing protein n=1 Tax=Georgenia satyanarayanai TaxID=860221 RepID=A0A2Y9A5L4_9MICO|nr:hypothetical protein [Georgenia satyanarayanai]PYG00957.1 hypothetical protein A8987_102115 [Georgenia satyanarayanai]SSA39196.1 hypothetical protein SAMN05216184_102115 [Georgenia satyanarayanai]
MTLTVTGGAAGILARVEDMRATADVLDDKGDAARELAWRVAAVATHEAVLSSQVLSPVTGGRVLAEVAQAQLPPEGLAWVALEYEAAAVFLRGSATAYEEVDAALARLADLGRGVTGVVVLHAGLLTAGGIAVTSLLLDALPEALADALTLDAFAAWLDEVGEDPAETVLGGLYDEPWVTDSIIAGLPWMLGTEVPLVLSVLTPWTFPPVPLSYEQMVAGVIGAGGLLGLFADGDPVVTPDPAPDGAAADSLAALFGTIGRLGDGDASEVRVTAVPDGGGGHSWIVEIPGTQDWAPESGSNPSNLGTNLSLMAGHDTAMEAAVLEAVHQAMSEVAAQQGVPLAELQAQPVTLAGHSQGGIVAAALAADPGTGLHVTQVVTGGSPIAGTNIPDDVAVLSIEHVQDPVPRLDGSPNPGVPGWTTVTRDVDGAEGVTAGSPISAHGGRVYADTAALVSAQAAEDPALALALQGLEEQFAQVRGGHAQVFQYDVRQEHR